MKLLSIKLTGYRNHKNFTCDFGPNTTQLVGPNGIGKTNILEAIHLMSTTKASRSKYDVELINHNEMLARVELTCEIKGEIENLELVIVRSDKFENGSKKLAKINKTAKPLNKFVGTFNSVLFTPTDIQIITGAPTLRRHYIDSILYQIDRDYKNQHTKYIKAIRHRNKILEKISNEHRGMDEIGFWTQEILVSGSNIQAKRVELFSELGDGLLQNMRELNSNNDKYELKYLMNEISRDRLEKYKEKEIYAKTTLVGPHRDDFIIEFNGKNIAHFGSRGQQRTTLLGLKISEIQFIERKTGNKPVLLLDDIFSELDPNHRTAVESITKLQQTIISTAHEAGETLEITS